MQCRKRKNPKVKIGVGSGGNQCGRNNPNWQGKNSHYWDVYDAKDDASIVRELCSSTKNLVIHHIDFNHDNNDPNNLQKVCRSCHAKIHNFKSHFSNHAESKPTQNGEASEVIPCSQQ